LGYNIFSKWRAKMSLNRIALSVLFLFIAGCVSAPTQEGAAPLPSASESEIQQLQARLTKLEEENLSLREQLDTAKEAEVRMPAGKEIQSALKNAGFYSGNIDGAIGTQTKEAIRKFQAENNLNPDGAVGSRTWSLLKKYLQEKTE
jgi:murein L,D-transpeptidase YcbB/YkuD